MRQVDRELADAQREIARLREALEDMLPLVGITFFGEHYAECVARVNKAREALAANQPEGKKHGV